jgi:hypothetical protein
MGTAARREVRSEELDRWIRFVDGLEEREPGILEGKREEGKRRRR